MNDEQKRVREEEAQIAETVADRLERTPLEAATLTLAAQILRQLAHDRRNP